MAKKSNNMTGEPGKRDYVVQTPEGHFVNIYFGSRWTPVPVNEATRFTKEMAERWIQSFTSEWYHTTTGELTKESKEVWDADAKCRPSTRHKILKVKTIIEET